MKRLLVGLINGLIAGAVAGLLLHQGKEPAPNGRHAGGASPTDPLIRARQAFARARQRAYAGSAAGGEGGTVGQGAAVPAAGWTEALKTRWQEAVIAGREASAEKQTELRRRYQEQTGRLPSRG